MGGIQRACVEGKTEAIQKFAGINGVDFGRERFPALYYTHFKSRGWAPRDPNLAGGWWEFQGASYIGKRNVN